MFNRKKAFVAEEQAFLEAYEKYADALYRHCVYRVFDTELAAEYVQEIFIRAWNHLCKEKTIDAPQAFLYRIANNLLIDAARTRKPTASLDVLHEQGFDPAAVSESTIADVIDGERLMEIMKKLDESSRQVLVMHYVDGLAPKEIASALDETANAISVRLHRAKKLLLELAQ